MDARVKGTLPSALSPAEGSAAVDFAFDVFDFALDPGPDSACPHNEITSSICTDATTSFSPMTPSTPSLDKFVIPKDGFIVLRDPYRHRTLAPCHPSMKRGAPVHRYFCGDADRLLFALQAHKVCPDSAAPSERRSRRARMTSS